MTLPIWPAGLSNFERSGWQSQPQDGRRKRQVDGGPPGYRRRFSRVARLVGLSLIVTHDQRELFWAFHDDACAAGSLLFRMPDPSNNGWALLASDGAPLLTGAGVPLLLARTWTCAWGDQVPAEVMTEQVRFRISFSVAVMP